MKPPPFVMLLVWLYTRPREVAFALSTMWVELWRFAYHRSTRFADWSNKRFRSALDQRWPGYAQRSVERRAWDLLLWDDQLVMARQYNSLSDAPIIRRMVVVVGAVLTIVLVCGVVALNALNAVHLAQRALTCGAGWLRRDRPDNNGHDSNNSAHLHCGCSALGLPRKWGQTHPNHAQSAEV